MVSEEDNPLVIKVEYIYQKSLDSKGEITITTIVGVIKFAYEFPFHNKTKIYRLKHKVEIRKIIHTYTGDAIDKMGFKVSFCTDENSCEWIEKFDSESLYNYFVNKNSDKTYNLA